MIFFFTIQSFSQQGTDLIKLDTLIIIHLDGAYNSNDMDSAKYHAKQALYLAKSAKNDTLLMKSYHAMAHTSKIKYDYDKAKIYTYKCLEIAKKIDNKYNIFLCNNLLGIIKSSEKQYQLSIEYYNNALSIVRETNDTLNESLLYHNIALNYYAINKFDLAKMFMQKSENTYNSITIFTDPDRKDFDYIYLYIKKSLVADTKKEALLFVDKAIDKAIETDFNFYTALAYKYKGKVYLKFNNIDLAIKNFQTGRSYERKANTKSSDSYIELINAYVKAEEFNTAKQYMDSLFQDFNYSNIRPITLDKNKIFSEIYLKVGDYSKAIFYANKRAAISDSLLKLSNNDLFAAYGKKFETKEKEKEIIKQYLVIEKQDSEKKNILLLGGLTLFVGLLLFQWKFNIQKNKKKDAEDAYEKEKDFNQMRTSFLENISHEIRTPLTLINGYLNLINDEVNNPKIKKYIGNALTNSKKVIFDADEILNLLKFEDHKMSKKISEKQLNSFLKSILSSFDVIASTRNLKLIYNSKIPDDYIVKIDAGKVDKILTNLISNALKFSDSNSKIIFDTELKNNNLVVKVTDFGQGIDKEDQERIFTRFYQSKNNKSIGGMGIGLLLAKDFAQFLNGDLKVESELGIGSTFIFTLPISELESKKTTPILTPETSKIETINPIKNLDKPSILIVEDNIEMSNFLNEILSPYYNCTLAFDGFEGLDYAQHGKFDLIASDIMMPKLNGYQFMEKIKQIPEYAKTPFIMITAKSLAEDKMKGFSLGIDDYITKPFTKEELIVRVDNLLQNSTSLKLCFTDENSQEELPETHVDKLVKKATKIIIKNLANENFKVENLALKMNYSQRQLSRILNKYTGLSPIKFILEIKLKKAYKMIENKEFNTISEVQYNIGISSPSYFSEKFKNRFGITPSELMKR